MANMAKQAPGVYVREIPSADKPIAGVGTSTAGFIGLFAEGVDGVSAQPLESANAADDDAGKVFALGHYPVVTAEGSFVLRADGKAVAGTLRNDPAARRAVATLEQVPARADTVEADYKIQIYPENAAPAGAGEVKLCTNFTEFTKSFGSFSSATEHSRLVHAVYGFFNNGGTRCYVVRELASKVADALARFEAIDEIAIVAAPGMADVSTRALITAHCQQATGDRFAILDTGEEEPATGVVKPDRTSYAALYYPWLEVADPAVAGRVYVPPSGHIAGIYARVDASRGVHKAPANETVLGALGLKVAVGKNAQGGLNEDGVNCIRSLNGNILVWGARTLRGPSETDLTYVNVRRLLLFLRKSIEQGTQWVIFEPNSPALWEKIKRNIKAFLTNVWRDGALFGATPDEAFYVKCDAETNPPELRNLGQVSIEIGVSIVKPAEFAIFSVSQWSGTAP